MSIDIRIPNNLKSDRLLWYAVQPVLRSSPDYIGVSTQEETEWTRT